MIKDSIACSDRYAGLPDAFQQAFRFLQSTDLAALPLGRVDIAEGIWANVMEYAPVDADEKCYEVHFAYADVQVIAAGQELLWETPASLDAYADEGDDCCLLDGAQGASCLGMQAGDFCIVYPGEAHKPGVADGIWHGVVKKVVIKVPVV